MEATEALLRDRSHAAFAQVQSDFLSGSFGRMEQVNEGTLALLRAGLTALPPAGWR